MDKKPLPKLPKIVDVGTDLGIEGYEGVEFEMWRDPSRSAMLAVLTAFITPASSIEKDEAHEFFRAVSEIVIDSSIPEISFGTVEEVKEAFDHESLPWGFVFNVVVSYVSTLIHESETLKKAFGLSEEVEPSGETNNEKE